jgi:hypothetical protein
MANANGWGDGASNNNIGWGKGADNAIGWGSVYSVSEAGATDIVGTPPVPPYSYLLDDYSGAAAAYSLRKLRSAYTGDAIRVRRSSDNTEQNIGFVSNVLDTASLLTFCGVGNGFVTTWYDQSGNAYNTTQSTAANQPQIVLSGAMLTTNGKNSIKFDGTNDSLATTGTPFSATDNTLIAVSKQDSISSYRRLFNIGSYVNGRFLGGANGTDDMLAVFSNATFTCSGGVAISQNVSIMYNAGTNGVLRNNGLQVNTVIANNSSYGNQDLFIGNDSVSLVGYFWNGIGQEFIFYPTSQAANTTGIESNINTFYTIY